jgi:hypothetical protein
VELGLLRLAEKTALGILILGASLLLSSCGILPQGNSHVKAPRFAGPPSAQRIQFIQSFPVLSQNGSVAPPQLNGITSPFGVLLVFLPSGDVVYCTVSHIVPGRVLTNAHCTEEDDNPSDYFVLYYNTGGQLVYTTIQGFGFIGSSQNYDAATLIIPSNVVQQWPAVPGQISSLGGVEMATVWAYDPLKIHTEFGSYGSDGMVFAPKNCLASRQMPQVYAAGKSTPIGLSNVNTSIHIVMDNCDITPVNGNSGSLITRQYNLSSWLGVFHWGESIDNPTQYSYYTYVGNRGQQILQSSTNLEFFQVGSAFDANPGIFSQ